MQGRQLEQQSLSCNVARSEDLNNESHLRSAIHALNSCFHFVFFGALDHDSSLSDEDDPQEKPLYTITPEQEIERFYRCLEEFYKPEEGPCFSGTRRTREELQTSALTTRKVTNISHCQQQDFWDCGVTCIQMILRWFRDCSTVEEGCSGLSKHDHWKSTSPLTPEEMEDRGRIQRVIGTQSIWTIDLFMILDRILSQSLQLCTRINFQSVMVSLLYSSRKLGVDESHKSLNYYKNAFRWDESRVKRQFKLAHEKHLPMTEMRNLDMGIVIDLVSREDVVAMALIDNNVIRRYDEEPEMDWNGNYIYDPKIMTFSGHYVLVCGTSSELMDLSRAKGNKWRGNDGKQICMVIKNPGSTEPVDLLTVDLFESAWKSNGTDDDIIFIRTVGKCI